MCLLQIPGPFQPGPVDDAKFIVVAADRTQNELTVMSQFSLYV